MTRIDYYFATISPFSYIAGLGLEAVAARHGAEIVYRPLDIMGLFARTGGVPPRDRHPSRQAYRLLELRRQAAKADLPIHPKPAFWPANPAPSSYAIIAAQATGEGDVGALAHAFLRACWAEERDIADADEVARILEGTGFDPALGDRGMMASADQYGRNLEDAILAGVFGAPFYVTGGEGFWGQDRLGDLDLHLAGKL